MTYLTYVKFDDDELKICCSFSENNSACLTLDYDFNLSNLENHQRVLRKFSEVMRANIEYYVGIINSDRTVVEWTDQWMKAGIV